MFRVANRLLHRPVKVLNNMTHIIMNTMLLAFSHTPEVDTHLFKGPCKVALFVSFLCFFPFCMRTI